MVHLSSADVSDSAVLKRYWTPSASAGPWVNDLFADGTYDRIKLMDKAAHHAHLDFVIEIIRRHRDHPPLRRAEGLRGLAQPLGRQAHLRLDDPLATPGARL